MFKSTKSLLLITSLAFPFSVYATESNNTETITMNQAMKDASFSLANDLLKTMNMERTYEGMIESVTKMQVQQNPKFKMIEPTIHTFFEKYMGWKALKDDMARMYAKSYTAEELKEVISFYKTKVGQKTLQIMPQISMKGTEIAQKKLSSHMGELKAMVEAELKKLAEETK